MNNKELLQQITQGEWSVKKTGINGKELWIGSDDAMLVICDLPTYHNVNSESNAILISKAPKLLKRNIELEEVLIEARELAQSVGYTFGNYNPTTIGGMMASDAKKVKDKIDQLIPIKYETNE